MTTSDDVPEPPPPPDIDRKFQLHRGQWIGIVLLLLIPVLAMFGLFGYTWHTVEGDTDALSVEMRYPGRYRYRVLGSMEMQVTNRTNTAIDTVTIDVDTAYLARFSKVIAIPDFKHAYLIELTDLEPGESRHVSVEIRAERPGLHRGEVRVSASPADVARLPLSTFIFP